MLYLTLLQRNKILFEAGARPAHSASRKVGKKLAPLDGGAEEHVGIVGTISIADCQRCLTWRPVRSLATATRPYRRDKWPAASIANFGDKEISNFGYLNVLGLKLEAAAESGSVCMYAGPILRKPIRRGSPFDMLDGR